MSANTGTATVDAIRYAGLIDRASLPGVAITSFAALLLELALTRIFSVILFYHFAFLAISIALLGFGVGGVLAYLWKNWLERFRTRSFLAWLSVLNAILIPVVLVIALHINVSLNLSRANLLKLALIYFCSAVPFFVTGLQFSVLFARQSAHIPRLYGADLAGGALACLATVPVLNWLGGPNAILFSALAAAIGGCVWAAGSLRVAPAIVAAFLLLLIVANYSGRLIDVVYAKGMARNKAQVEFARWNSISRVEVCNQGNTKTIVIDADAATYLVNADPTGSSSPAWPSYVMSSPSAVVNALRPRGEYAIIGPGGGIDVFRAVANGSPSVTGIEINSIIATAIMRDRYADYSQHLYERPDVHIVVSDGRSFIRNAKRSFDVVQMTLVDTWASTAAGAFALSENNLYTVEAFREYFEHLKPDGMIVITRWEFREPREALRVASMAMEALRELGVRDLAHNFVVVSQGELNEGGTPVTVLAKKSPFTLDEEQTVRYFLTSYPKILALHLPSQRQGNPFSELISSNNATAFAQGYAYNVAPVHDSSPFFFFTLKLDQLYRQRVKHGIDWKVNFGVVVLAVVLVTSLLSVLALLIIPMAVRAGLRQKAVPLVYFVAVGLGYILVEIAFIQRFVLFLGHPTYALTVVLFLLLSSSGSGSLASRRLLAKTERSWLPLAFVSVTLFLYVFTLPVLLNTLIGLPFLAKLLVSGCFLVPLGAAMGMPFPTGLRAIAALPAPEFVSSHSGSTENAIEWAWAMNAGSSVLGSVLAIVIAIEFGLNATLACGAAAYASAILLSRRLKVLSPNKNCGSCSAVRGA